MTPDELRSRRLALGLSQTGMAERLGIPRNTWHRWESGAMEVGHPTILALALDRLASQPRPVGRPRKRPT